MDSVVIYRSFVEASKALAPEEFKECWMKIFEYALDEEEPDEIQSPLAEAIFIMAKPQIDANKKRKVDGAKGGAPKGNKNAKKQPVVESKNNHRLSDQQPNVNVNVNVNDNVNDNVNVNNNNILLFCKPTQKEVEDFCRGRGLKTNPKSFYQHYSLTDWKDGSGDPIKNWQLTLLAWEKNADGKKGFADFKQNSYDFDALEKELLANGG